jgi:hypothetical protein
LASNFRDLNRILESFRDDVSIEVKLFQEKIGQRLIEWQSDHYEAFWFSSVWLCGGRVASAARRGVESPRKHQKYYGLGRSFFKAAKRHPCHTPVIREARSLPTK